MINLQVSITAAYLRSNSLNTVVHTLVVQSINVANEKFIVAPVNWGGISITRNVFANVENAGGNTYTVAIEVMQATVSFTTLHFGVAESKLPQSS